MHAAAQLIFNDSKVLSITHNLSNTWGIRTKSSIFTKKNRNNNFCSQLCNLTGRRIFTDAKKQEVVWLSIRVESSDCTTTAERQGANTFIWGELRHFYRPELKHLSQPWLICQCMQALFHTAGFLHSEVADCAALKTLLSAWASFLTA